MLFSLLTGEDFTSILINILLSMPVILLALSLHETAHGYVAWKCGDNTAYNLGRLTLNPIKHLDPMGFVSMLIFGFGWAKPVPINTRAFRNPKRGMALSALAGPVANLILGLISAVFYALFSALMLKASVTDAPEILSNALYFAALLCQLGALYNFLFMAFNLIPVPPFDGSRVALLFLPQRFYFSIMRYERQIMLGLLVALLVLSRFNISPFSWIAEELTFNVAKPLYRVFNRLLGNPLF